MVSMLIVCGKQQEAEGIRTQIREFAGLFSEEKWEYHLYQNTEQLKEYLERIPEINLACMDLDVKDGIHYARQVRKENRQAFLILIANPEMSPMSYMRPDIMAESLITIIPVISYLSVYNFLLQDLAKLAPQKRAIMKSMKTATVDHSIFHNEELKRNLVR